MGSTLLQRRLACRRNAWRLGRLRWFHTAVGGVRHAGQARAPFVVRSVGSTLLQWRLACRRIAWRLGRLRWFHAAVVGGVRHAGQARAPFVVRSVGSTLLQRRRAVSAGFTPLWWEVGGRRVALAPVVGRSAMS
ncbi:hypothetical protein [Streptosporangium sp. KLBMP 9127]|nr:hypothetical protein [Streptosporangium sp. KLBMP 9127]